MMAVALFSAFILIRSNWPSGGHPYEEVDMEKAMAYMEYEGDFLLIDLDSPEVFAASSLSGMQNAVNIPYQQLIDDPILLLTDKSSMIYLFSEDDDCSQKAAMKLTSTGYNSVTRIVNDTDNR